MKMMYDLMEIKSFVPRKDVILPSVVEQKKI